MSYRKISRVALHTNSVKNLILRQKYAMKLLKVVDQGKVLLALDETWISMSDYRRMKWRVKGSSNSVPVM